jgi:hypothetical protein
MMQALCERRLQNGVLFQVLFWKDLFCALSNIAIIIVVQWGIMNRCSCWAGMGSTWVHLPQLREVKTELMYLIRHVAPFIVFAALVFHFGFCAAVVWKYRDAFRVFIQRDDGASNLKWQSQVAAKHETQVRVAEVVDDQNTNAV